MFTGSGFPMRFADTDGSLIDVYQAATQLTDESEIDIAEAHPGAARRRSRRPRATTASSRPTCTPTARPPGRRRRSSPKRRRAACPSSRAAQMLDWLDGRNDSSFQGLVATATESCASRSRPARGARGLEAMVPAAGPAGPSPALRATARPSRPRRGPSRASTTPSSTAAAGSTSRLRGDGGGGRSIRLRPRRRSATARSPAAPRRSRSPSMRQAHASSAASTPAPSRPAPAPPVHRPGRRPAHVRGARRRPGRQRRPYAGDAELHRRQQRRGRDSRADGVHPEPPDPRHTARLRAASSHLLSGPDAVPPTAAAAPGRAHARRAHRLAARGPDGHGLAAPKAQHPNSPYPCAEHAGRRPGDHARQRRSPPHDESKDPLAGATRQVTDRQRARRSSCREHDH